MSLIVTGSVAIDSVKSPHGVSENCMGGAAVYFSLSASFFTGVRLVGVVGDDYPFDLRTLFQDREVDLRGLEVRAGSKTFVWHGTYHEDMNERTTDHVELNVLLEAPPQVPEAFKDSKYVFLANTAPALQLELLDQVAEPAFVAADTMNLWVEEKAHLADLKRLLSKVDCLIVNDDEAKLLAGHSNLIKAAGDILAMGMNVVVIKKGESGALMCSKSGEKFVLPAYPASEVVDPTGAGDSFAGGFLGYVAQTGKTDFGTLRSAVAYGTVVASFTIADFSMKGLTGTTRAEIDARLETLRQHTTF